MAFKIGGWHRSLLFFHCAHSCAQSACPARITCLPLLLLPHTLTPSLLLTRRVSAAIGSLGQSSRNGYCSHSSHFAAFSITAKTENHPSIFLKHVKIPLNDFSSIKILQTSINHQNTLACPLISSLIHHLLIISSFFCNFSL